MRDYELVALISPEIDEEGVGKIVERIGQSISSRGGALEKVDKWGRRKLAYPVKKFLEADYVVARFKLMPNLVKELEAEMRGWGDVLRYLVVRVED